MAKEKENTSPEKNKPAKEKTVKEEKSSKAAADSKAEKKSDKKSSNKKEQGKVGKWFHDLKVEFKKVVWPTKKTVVTNTSVVVGVVALSAVFVGLLDEGFLALLRLIYK
ncbi:MAG: preprotein translocase subunit SecE [Ruminococcus sp.]|nr:preprotein translocase subunit SecE [Ruminococcus sp.]